MPFESDSLELLESRARAWGVPLAVVELTESPTYDREAGQPVERLRVSVVLRAPGRDDSRFRQESLGYLRTGSAAARDEALRTAAELGARLQAPLSPGPGAARKAGAPGWMHQQGPSPPRPWRVAWTRVSWHPDGREQVESGEREEVACSGAEAHYAAGLALRQGRSRPFVTTIGCVDFDEPSTSHDLAAYPSAAPPQAWLRTHAAEGRSLSTLALLLTTETPALSVLERMTVLEQALGLDASARAPLGAFFRGELDVAALDAALGAEVNERELTWRLPLELQRAVRRGASIGPVLSTWYERFPSVLPFLAALRDAFSLSLRAASLLISLGCCRGRPHPVLDQALRAALEAQRAGKDDHAAVVAVLMMPSEDVDPEGSWP